MPPPRPGQSPGTAPESFTPSPDAIRIRRTLSAIGPIADKVISHFYAVLFLQHPDVRDMFPVAMNHQRDRILRALLTAAEKIDDVPALTPYLRELSRGHRKYGTKPEHYPPVGEALLAALRRFAPDVWDEETEAAWVRAYTTISQIMIDAAAEAERLSPSMWLAEIVAHQVPAPDIAVITVRPDQPYPFIAGQYTSLETPWWPRVWRPYSFAAAPSSAGLLHFHVKAVPAGWVSSALVRRAKPGDVIRLGPPQGAMKVDHDSDSSLLCVGGGTGVAPIKAMVEDVVEHGRPRLIEVFYGARIEAGLYDLNSLFRLARQHAWLRVRPVVSGGYVPGRPRALLQAVRQGGLGTAYDAYLSGPPGMIRAGVDTLLEMGIPAPRIRHDLIGDQEAAPE